MPEPISLQTVRLYVDGELAADDAARLERLLEGDVLLQRQVAAEQALRESVGRSMRASAPPDLLGRIQAALATAPADAPSLAPDSQVRRPQLLSGPRFGASRPRSARHPRRWLVGPQRVNVFAVAACLLLVAGAVLVGIYGRTIDQLRWQQPVDVAGVELLEFVQREHARSGDPVEAEKECLTHSPAEAAAILRQDFGLNVEIPDLTAAGYQFDGIASGDWHGESVPKLRYRYHTGNAREPRISILISKNLDYLDCSSGRLPGCGKMGDHRVWEDHGVVYLMKACKPTDLTEAYALLHGESPSSAR